MILARESMGDLGLTYEQLYKYYGYTRQGFHQALHRLRKIEAVIEEIKVSVCAYRNKTDVYAGSRSLFYNLDIKEIHLIGVNKFERLMQRAGLTLCRVKTRIITTRSCPKSKHFKNEINGLTINGINQVIVGDLTYVYIDNRLYYLFCLFDLYSGRMVGAFGGLRMRAIEAAQALNQVIELRTIKSLAGCIHHTDGGSQYFSNMYLALNAKMTKSVAQSCLENGYAEQRNGLIKIHFMPLINGRNEKNFINGIEFIKNTYNNIKQEGLGWLSPIEFEEKWEKLSIETRPKLKLYDFNKI